MSGQLMPVNSHSFTSSHISFQTFLPYFSYRLLFSCKSYHRKGVAAYFLGISPMTCLVSSFYPLFVNFAPILDILQSSCSIFFFKHDLTLFTRALSVQRIRLLFLQWFDMVDIRVAFSHAGTNLTSCRCVAHVVLICRSHFTYIFIL